MTQEHASKGFKMQARTCFRKIGTKPNQSLTGYLHFEAITTGLEIHPLFYFF